MSRDLSELRLSKKTGEHDARRLKLFLLVLSDQGVAEVISLTPPGLNERAALKPTGS